MLRIETILAAALKHGTVAGELGEALRNDLVVANPIYRNILTFYLDFWEKNRAFPKDGDVELWFLTQPEGILQGTRESWHRLMQESISEYSPEYLAEQALPALQSAAARNAIARLNQSMDPTPEMLQALSEQVASVQSLGLLDLANIRDVERWVRNEDLDWTIPTGIHALDKYIGGWSEELVFVLADSGTGKSTFLINTGQHACMLGKKVLHITFELSKARTMHRYYRRITETDLPTYRRDIKKVIEQAQYWIKRVKGELFVHYEPAYTTDPTKLRVIVDKFAQKYGGVDMLILDSIDLMVPTKSRARGNTYEEQGVIAHEVRALCPEYHCVAMSAAQATRAQGRTRLHQSDMADSYGKVRAAGILAGLVQTEEEADNHQARLTLLKVRDNPGKGIEIPLFVDLDLMMLADLDSVNSLRIMKEKGWLPSVA